MMCWVNCSVVGFNRRIRVNGSSSSSSSSVNNYVYQAVIDKKYLSKNEIKLLDEEPKELEPWDPMGTLA